MRRKEKIVGLEEAAEVIEDEMTVALGGWGPSLWPMAMIREIIRRGVRDLKLVSPPTSLNLDFLLGAGCVKKITTPYVGGETLIGIAPIYRRMVEEGLVDVWETGGGMLVAGLRAAILGLPFLPRRGGIGTSIPEVNPDLKIFEDPIRGEKLIAVPPIKPDVAIIHAAYSDPYGNIVHQGPRNIDRLLARASDSTIVEVERVIPHEMVKVDPSRTTIPSYNVDMVVRAPFGAHPSFCPGFYLIDREHLEKEYVPAARSWAKGDKEPFNEYLNKYVFEPKTHEDYLEVIGVKRLIKLMEGV
ncbi:MAG: CoA transferase subunit A [Candidatus Geothermarchaeales archaeon]